MMKTIVKDFLQQITLPDDDSHKGQNGKLLIIGGSELFHSASKWSLDVASKFVDMVFYASVPSNNELVQVAKGEFWNGIVIPRAEIEAYVEEADCILIGPGMERLVSGSGLSSVPEKLTVDQWNNDTQLVVNYLLTHYPDKKMVIDAGALQMANPHLFSSQHILTPHLKELERVLANFVESEVQADLQQLIDTEATILLKGEVDHIYQADTDIPIEGGNAGMTKGGTGDTLAGLVAALYCTHDALVAAVVGSYINKKAGDTLWERMGPYFNASDLVEEVPFTMWSELQAVSQG